MRVSADLCSDQRGSHSGEHAPGTCSIRAAQGIGLGPGVDRPGPDRPPQAPGCESPKACHTSALALRGAPGNPPGRA
jgi:hypothetical protein